MALYLFLEANKAGRAEPEAVYRFGSNPNQLADVLGSPPFRAYLEESGVELNARLEAHLAEWIPRKSLSAFDIGGKNNKGEMYSLRWKEHAG